MTQNRWSLSSARQLAREAFERVLQEGDIAIDATMGNGYDTLTLAKLVGNSGQVHAFDVSPLALENTRKRLEEAGLSHRVSLHLKSHADLLEIIHHQVQLICFNLGWLPGGDKQLTTKLDSTRKAVLSGLQCLNPQGMIVICIYPGHPEGEREKEMLLELCASLPPQSYNTLWQHFPNAWPGAPLCCFIQKNSL